MVIERYVKQYDENLSKRWYDTYKFKVFKLSESKWSKVKSLGDNIVLVGTNSSTCYAIPHGKKICIYYSDHHYECHTNLKDERERSYDNGDCPQHSMKQLVESSQYPCSFEKDGLRELKLKIQSYQELKLYILFSFFINRVKLATRCSILPLVIFI